MQGGYGGLSGRGDRGRRRRGLSRGVRRKGRSRQEAIRAQVLREFRGIGERLDPEHNVTRVGELLGEVLRSLKLEEGIEESRLRGAWREVAGEFVARQTALESLRNGVLVLRVLQPSMRFHLEQSRLQLLRRLQQNLGATTVREVRLVIG